MKIRLVSQIAVFSLLSYVAKAGDHENIHEVNDALNRAKGTHNVEDLVEAKHRLENVIKKNKSDPRRKDALNAVDQAIASLKSGNRVEADKKINSALASLEETVAESQHKKKNGKNK